MSDLIEISLDDYRRANPYCELSRVLVEVDSWNEVMDRNIHKTALRLVREVRGV